MSSNCVELNGVIPPPVRTLVYPDMASRPAFGEVMGKPRREQSERRKQAGGVRRLSLRRRSLRNAFRWNGPRRFEKPKSG